jgi:hypothetical protein
MEETTEKPVGESGEVVYRIRPRNAKRMDADKRKFRIYIRGYSREAHFTPR